MRVRSSVLGVPKPLSTVSLGSSWPEGPCRMEGALGKDFQNGSWGPSLGETSSSREQLGLA